MTIKYFPNKVNARNAYPDLCRDEQKQLPKLNNHLYYGKVEHGVCWKATRLIQIVSAISLAALTFGLLFVSKEFRKFLEGRIKEIKDPYKYIYIQEQFQKNFLRQVPKEDQKQEPQNREDKKESVDLLEPILKREKLLQEIHEKESQPVQPVDFQDQPKIQIEAQLPKEIQKPITLQDRFNQIVQRFQEKKMDAENNIEMFCQSLENKELLEVFEFCEKIEPLQHRDSFIETFVRTISIDQLSFCLERSPNQMEIYTTILGMVIFACHDKDENSNKKMILVIENLIKKVSKSNYEDPYSMIYDHVFASCRSLEQLNSILTYHIKKLDRIVLYQTALQAIVQKDWVAKFIELDDRSILKDFIKHCDDPKICFALKKEIIKQGKYNQAFLNSLYDGLRKDSIRNKIENCAEDGFKEPVPQLLDVKISTEIEDENGQLLEVFVYDAKFTHNNSPVYQLKTKDQKVLGNIALQPNENFIDISFIECSVSRSGPKRLPILKALHEFALKESFRHKLMGKVRIKNKCNSVDVYSSEHFFFGYCFPEEEKIKVSCNLKGKMKELIEEYLDLRDAQKSTDEIINKIKNFEKGLNIVQHHSETATFRTLYNTARCVLGRELNSMQEILDHGISYDKNAFLKKVIKNHPYFRPELKKLIFAYSICREKQEQEEILKKLETPKFIKQLEKIYIEMEFVQFRDTDPDDIEKIIAYAEDYSFYAVNYQGSMHLCDEKIEELKKEYQL